MGHEFSHILNGDMKINMRLTAWIFGLVRHHRSRAPRHARPHARQGEARAQDGRVRHLHCRQCRHVCRPPVAGRRVAPSRTSGRRVVRAVHAQSAGAAGRLRRHGGAALPARVCRTLAPSAYHTCSLPRASRSWANKLGGFVVCHASAARGARTRARCASDAAQIPHAGQRREAQEHARARRRPPRPRQLPRHPRRRRENPGAGWMRCHTGACCQGAWLAASRTPSPRPLMPSATRAPAPTLQHRRMSDLAPHIVSARMPSRTMRTVAGRSLCRPTYCATGSARNNSGDRDARGAASKTPQSPCRRRSSPPCWLRSRQSGARNSRASRRCWASNYSRKRRRRSRTSAQLAPAVAPAVADRPAVVARRHRAGGSQTPARRCARVRAHRGRPATCCAFRSRAFSRKQLAKAGHEVRAGAAARAGCRGRVRAVLRRSRSAASVPANKARILIAPASWACCRRRNGRRIPKR